MMYTSLNFCGFGWPVSYTSEILPTSLSSNHHSAVAFSDHVQHYIQTELSYHAIAGPFSTNPLHQPLVCSPLQSVPKQGSIQRRVVMDLSFPPQSSVNGGMQPQVIIMSPTSLDSQALIVYAILFFNMAKVTYSIKRIYDERTDKSLSILKIITSWVFCSTVACIPIVVALLAYELAPWSAKELPRLLFSFLRNVAIWQTFIWTIYMARNAPTEHHTLFVIFRPYSIV